MDLLDLSYRGAMLESSAEYADEDWLTGCAITTDAGSRPRQSLLLLPLVIMWDEYPRHSARNATLLVKRVD